MATTTKGRKGISEKQLRSELDSLFAELVERRRPLSLRRARREFERAYVEYIMSRCAGQRRRAAHQLDIGFSTLKEKIRST